MKRRRDLLANTSPTPHKASSMRAADGDATGTGACALRTFRTLLQTRKRVVLSSLAAHGNDRWRECNEPRRPRVSRCGTLRWEGPLKPTRAATKRIRASADWWQNIAPSLHWHARLSAPLSTPM
jgi:hypothetical protein